MTSAADLLPKGATLKERAVAFALTDLLPVPIADILDPAKTPTLFQPFLAAHESVDLWYGDWPDARKREMIARAMELAALKGTAAALKEFLPFVDAEIVQKITYPRRFVLGRSAVGIQPLNHRAFTTHLLLRVPLKRPANSFIIGRSALGRMALRTPDSEPIRRVDNAVRVAKAPDTLVSVNYGHRRPVTVEDNLPLDGSVRLGGYLNRKKL